jgi:hypothetical protein
MAVTGKWYGQSVIKAFSKEINYISDTIKVLLCTNLYTPDQDAHVHKSDITNEVANGNGYTSGGIALSNKIMTYNSGDNVVSLDADDIAWQDANITARYAVIYDDTPATDSTKPLLGYVDFGKDYVCTDSEFRITWDSSGLLKAVAS